MKSINVLLFIFSLLLIPAYFVVSMVASYYAITSGSGLLIISGFAGMCVLVLLSAILIKLKLKTETYNKTFNVLCLVFCVLLILLSLKSIININKQIEFYSTVKNFTK